MTCLMTLGFCCPQPSRFFWVKCINDEQTPTLWVIVWKKKRSVACNAGVPSRVLRSLCGIQVATNVCATQRLSVCLLERREINHSMCYSNWNQTFNFCVSVPAHLKSLSVRALCNAAAWLGVKLPIYLGWGWHSVNKTEVMQDEKKCTRKEIYQASVNRFI